ncbi:B3 domain-containing protein At4g34400-like [Andrographis paniculata]|uniref:B3 domain-containing protein At4g34400-like n=1 Tax=Andrographis paniculata TaxID=175694 RepID=UPI0021E95FC8|nr:B3 domain-containing protein At4g34400-like [Andrographis paniculata]
MKFEDGDFLFFEYFTKGFFDVNAFGPSGMEKIEEKYSSENTDVDNEVNEVTDEYEPINNVEVTVEHLPIDNVEMTKEINEASEDDHVQNNQEIEQLNIERTLPTRDQQDSERLPRDRIEQRYGIDIFRAGLASQPRNPYFVTGVMDKRKGNLFVPRDVVQDNNIDFSKKAQFIDSTGRRLMARCKEWKDGRISISGGWRKVCTFNNIDKDDRCICELVEGEDELAIHVIVVRANQIRG